MCTTMSQQTSSQSSGNAAKTGAYIGAAAYLVTHFIPMSGYKHVLDWMHSSVMSLLNITPNKIAGSPENLTGVAIYALGWGVFAALGMAVGALVGGRTPADPTESANLPNLESETKSARVSSADDVVVAANTSPDDNAESVVTADAESSTSSEPEEEAAHAPASTPVGEALGAGAVGGAAAALAAHYFAGGKLTFPIFIVVYILMFSRLKGSGKFVGLVSFVIVGGLVLAIMKNFVG